MRSVSVCNNYHHHPLQPFHRLIERAAPMLCEGIYLLFRTSKAINLPFITKPMESLRGNVKWRSLDFLKFNFPEILDFPSIP